MSRNSRRSVAIAVAGAVAITPLVAACAAGRSPQTALPTQLAEGVNASAHLVDIRNTFLLGPEPGRRLQAGAAAPLYAWFVNRAATPDKLISVEAPGVAQAADVTGGGVVLPSGTLVSTVQKPGSQPAPPPRTATPLPARTPATGSPTRRPLAPGKTTPAAGTATPTPGKATPAPPATAPSTLPAPASSAIVLRGLAKDLVGGETIRLTFHFQQAGVITLNIPVVPRAGSYATFAPAAAPPVAPPVAQPAKPSVKPTPAVSPTAGKKKPKTTA